MLAHDERLEYVKNPFSGMLCIVPVIQNHPHDRGKDKTFESIRLEANKALRAPAGEPFNVPVYYMRNMAYFEDLAHGMKTELEGSQCLMESPVVLPTGHKLWKTAAMEAGCYTTFKGAVEMQARHPKQAIEEFEICGKKNGESQVLCRFLNYAIFNPSFALKQKELSGAFFSNRSVNAVSGATGYSMLLMTGGAEGGAGGEADSSTLLTLATPSKLKKFYPVRWDPRGSSAMVVTLPKSSVKRIRQLTKAEAALLMDAVNEGQEVLEVAETCLTFYRRQKTESSIFLALQLAVESNKAALRLRAGWLYDNVNPEAAGNNLLLRSNLAVTYSSFECASENVIKLLPRRAFVEWICEFTLLANLTGGNHLSMGGKYTNIENDLFEKNLQHDYDTFEKALDVLATGVPVVTDFQGGYPLFCYFYVKDATSIAQRGPLQIQYMVKQYETSLARAESFANF